MPGFEKGRVRRILSHGFSAIIAVSGPNFFYLTGKDIKSFERSLFIAATRDECLIVAPKLEEERVSDIRCGEMILYSDGEDPFPRLSAELRAMGVKGKDVIALDPEMKIDLFFKLSQSLSDFNLVNGKEAILIERMKKDDYELESIGKAASILDELFKEAESLISEGVTEAEIMMKLSFLSQQLGSDAPKSLSVQSGPNTAVPHHEYSSRKIKKGDIVLLDLVVSYEGYNADLTRVFSLGRPDAEIERAYEAVREALEAGIAGVKVGIPAGDLDFVVREKLKERGLEKQFTHRTGHGIGIDIHELPNVAPHSKDVIEERSVFTIEPGVYFPNKFGVRLEVDVVALKGRAEILGQYPLELKVI
ncbi:MAG: hypothetical protein C0179_03215 [Fervidicoccus sp.]|nr:MAG: hypothetical protein C0179_03215 [Fervidicoccus sp.]